MAKLRAALLLVCASSIAACGSHGADTDSTEEDVAASGRAAKEKDDPSAPGAYFMAQRAFPSAAVPPGALGAAADQWLSLVSQQHIAPDGRWKLVGPAPLDMTGGQLPNAGPGSGRATALAIHPTQPSIVYLGTAMGGVWRSDDGGGSWRPLTDAMASMAVGALAIDPAAPDTVYAGTGESSLSGDAYFGRGLLKSLDGGKTWATLGASELAGAAISKVLLGRGAVYVTTTTGKSGSGGCGSASTAAAGLFKSTDGGLTWANLVKGAAVDVELDPTPGATRMLVSLLEKGIVTFDEADASQAPVVLPADLGMRIELARGKTNPLVVYAGGEAGVLRSVDGGVTWAAVPNAPTYCKGQCWYDNVVEVDPTDDDAVYLGGSLCSVQKLSAASTATPKVAALTIPGGNCQKPQLVWTTALVHPDVHAIAFDPTNPRVFFVASDGGVAQTDDQGLHWNRRNEGLATNQFYHLCVDPNDSTVMLGGMQDNGTAQISGFPGSTVWNQVGPGDGAACLVNLKDPERAKRFVLTSAQYGSFVRTGEDGVKARVELPFDQGQDGDESFVTILEQDSATPTTVYSATARVYRSVNGGKDGSWEAISPKLAVDSDADTCNSGSFLTALGVARGSQRLYAGSSGGHVFTSPDGGATWADVTHDPLPRRWITQIAVQADDPKIVYVSFSGFGDATPSARGHVFRSNDAGATWTRFDAAAEPLDLPVNTLVVHPQNPSIIYAGTDLGVLATLDGGASWQILGSGLPNVAAYALVFHERDSKLFVGTHGRSAWELPLEPKIVSDVPAVAMAAAAASAPVTATLAVKNGEVAGSILDYTVSVEGAPWLAVSIASGRVSGLMQTTHTLTATLDGLAAGPHTATVVIRDVLALVPELRVPVTLTVN